MRDNRSSINIQSMLAPAVLTADATSAAIDTAGYDAATVEIHVAAGGITFSGSDKIEFLLTHCDTSGGTYEAVTDADVLLPASQTVGAGGIVKSLIAAHAAASVTRVGYIGNKRYLKLAADFSGTHGTGTGISASLVQDRARLKAVA